MAEHPFLILDVFTQTPLTGNQLAVFSDAAAIPEDALQRLALEMGFSETVFVFPPTGDQTARIRIFTPRNELPFAGHPVLGTAVALALPERSSQVVLATGRGDVPLSISNLTDRSGFGTMAQPLPSIAPYPNPERLLDALGVRASALPVEVYDNGIPHVYVVLEDTDAVAALRPDLAALERLAHDDALPILGVNCCAGTGTRWKTRMFAPADGVSEDAATGSAAGPLACHIARHGLVRFDETVTVIQGVEIGRPSTLFATAYGSAEEITAVEVAGHAVLVAHGTFRL